MHLTLTCRVHGYRLGGCKCIIATGAEAERFELADCAAHCPAHGREVTWDDIYMGERDVE